MINKVDTFEFAGYQADGSTLKFQYRVIGDTEYTFTEQIILPQPVPASVPHSLLDLCLRNLHLILGISYYKAFLPKRISVKGYSLTKEQAIFWNTVYTKGLGEFFYRNQIDYRGLISFPFHDEPAPAPVSLPRRDRALVGIGGGKDSIVSVELLKRAEYPISGFIMSSGDPNEDVERVVAEMGVDVVSIRRLIDEQLIALNRSGRVYNGHIPISAVYAFTGILAAVLYDYRYVIVSNEKSANIGNVEYHGEMVNHQWSKSYEFERLLRDYSAAYITPDVTYFSLLRPFDESAIAARFVQYSQYLPIFTSCNLNFRRNKGDDPSLLSGGLWCGHCPKCAFTFLMLAALLPRPQVISVFGKDLFADESLSSLYQELAGLTRVKPFDCVGTYEEVREAFHTIRDQKSFANTPVMAMAEQQIMKSYKQAPFEAPDYSSLPEQFRHMVK